MEKIKLVTQDYKTRVGFSNETLWEFYKRIDAKGKGGLCSRGVVHSYDSIWVALLMNPKHACIENPRALVVEVPDEGYLHDGTKGGSKWATPLREIPVPEMPFEKKVEIAIRCVLEISVEGFVLPGDEPKFVAWALHWLDGSDRSVVSAEAAAKAARPAWANWKMVADEVAEAWAAAAMAAEAAKAAAMAAEATWEVATACARTIAATETALLALDEKGLPDHSLLARICDEVMNEERKV